MFIRVQNIKRDENNVILSGSASVVRAVYDTSVKGGHCRQETVLNLGKVLWINEGKTKGIFDSKSRGIVEYDLTTNSFANVDRGDDRISGTKVDMQEKTHTNFGDAYIFFSLVSQSVIFNVIRETFPDERKLERVIVHLMHECLRNRSGARCGQFLEASMASYIFRSFSSSTLNCDTGYFTFMGDDNTKKIFFQTLVKHMRKEHPDFGRACYIDSTPLPNESQGFPYKALCSHGTDGLLMQARLALVMDIETGVPIWFHTFSSNVLDQNNILDVKKDVQATLGIDIDIATLDAGYSCKELLRMYNIDNNTYIDDNGEKRDRFILVRMPQKAGYPHDELYLECKPRLYSALHLFDYDGHSYYGERFEREIFGCREYCYVFLDRKQAEELGGKWRTEHRQEWEMLCDSDKEWYSVKDGFFILIGSKWLSPKDALVEYKSREKVEEFFKDGKAYVGIMPLSSWSKTTVLGKILHDVMEIIVYRHFRTKLAPLGTSVSHFLTEVQSLDCVKQASDSIEVFTAKKQVREYYEILGYTVPGFLELGPFKAEIMEGKPMDRTPPTVARKRPGRKPGNKKIRHSPEEKARMADEKKREKAQKKEEEKAERKRKREEEKAKSQRRKDEEKAKATPAEPKRRGRPKKVKLEET